MNKDNTNALLDKVENTARRIALALGGMFIASIASAILVNEWIIELPLRRAFFRPNIYVYL